MRNVVRQTQYMPFSKLSGYDVRLEQDPMAVNIFYAQSVTIIDFMIARYGSYKFGSLCRAMQEGMTFEQALQSVYKFSVGTMAELENKWLQYMGK